MPWNDYDNTDNDSSEYYAPEDSHQSPAASSDFASDVAAFVGSFFHMK